MNPASTLVTLPSYNESANIIALIDELLSLKESVFVCVVDDSSPDGTSPLVRKTLAERENWKNRVHLITRTEKSGRGGAVRAAFEWGIKSGREFNAFVEMDCDFSHLPSAVPTGLKMLGQGYDVVLGSRYPDGVIEGWPWSRRIFSALANQLARVLISFSIADYTNGFRFYTQDSVKLLLTHKQKNFGYIYLSETLSHFLKANLRIGSFPIHFKNRERGVSNTSMKEISSAFTGILRIAYEHRKWR